MSISDLLDEHNKQAKNQVKRMKFTNVPFWRPLPFRHGEE
jgi:hypothetical protein